MNQLGGLHLAQLPCDKLWQSNPLPCEGPDGTGGARGEERPERLGGGRESEEVGRAKVGADLHAITVSTRSDWRTRNRTRERTSSGTASKLWREPFLPLVRAAGLAVRAFLFATRAAPKAGLALCPARCSPIAHLEEQQRSNASKLAVAASEVGADCRLASGGESIAGGAFKAGFERGEEPASRVAKIERSRSTSFPPQSFAAFLPAYLSGDLYVL